MSPECQDGGSIGKIQLVRAGPSSGALGISPSLFCFFLVFFSISRVERLQQNQIPIVWISYWKKIALLFNTGIVIHILTPFEAPDALLGDLPMIIKRRHLSEHKFYRTWNQIFKNRATQTNTILSRVIFDFIKYSSLISVEKLKVLQFSRDQSQSDPWKCELSLSNWKIVARPIWFTRVLDK